MSPLIAVTQRVSLAEEYQERRDALDQRWHQFLAACGLLPLLLPNDAALAQALLERCQPDGVLLTGGNDLASLGGTVPERDKLETWLLGWAMARLLPVLGVCRGMQVIQQHFGIALQPVRGQITSRQRIRLEGEEVEVNSYHRWGAFSTVAELEIWGQAEDGLVKAIRSRGEPLLGIMWHPERCTPFHERDLALFQSFYRGEQ